MNRRSNDKHPNQEQITNASNPLADSVLQRGRWGQRYLKNSTTLTSMVQRTPLALTSFNINSLVQRMDQTGAKAKASQRPIGVLSATFIDRSTPKSDNLAPEAQATVQPIQRTSEAHFQQPANLVWDGISESPTPAQEAAELAETFPYTVAQIREALDRHQAGLPPVTPTKRREPPIQRQSQSDPEQNPALPYTVAQIRDALDRLKSGQAGGAGQTPLPSSAIQRRSDDANPIAPRSGPTTLAELQRALSEAQPFERSQPTAPEIALQPTPSEDNVKVIQPRRSRQWVEAMALRHSKPFPPLPQKHATTPDPGSMESIQRQPAESEPPTAPEPATDDDPNRLTKTVRRLPHPNEPESEAGSTPLHGIDRQRQIEPTPPPTAAPDIDMSEPEPTTEQPLRLSAVPDKLKSDRIDSPAPDRGQIQRQVETPLPEPTASDSTPNEIVQEMTLKPQKVEPKPTNQTPSEPAPTTPPPAPIDRHIQRQAETLPEPVAPNIVSDKTDSKIPPLPQKVEPTPAYQPPVEPGQATPSMPVERQIQRQVETPSEPTTPDIVPGEIVEEAVTKPQKIEPKPAHRTPVQPEPAAPLPPPVERQIQRQGETSPEPIAPATIVEKPIIAPQPVEPAPVNRTPVQPEPVAPPPPVEHQLQGQVEAPAEPAMVDIVSDEPVEEVVTAPQKIEPTLVNRTPAQLEPTTSPPPTERHIQRQVEAQTPEPVITQETTPGEIVEETVTAPQKIEPKPGNRTPVQPEPAAPSPPVEPQIQRQVEASPPEPTESDIVPGETAEKAATAPQVIEPDSANRAPIQPEPAVSPPVENQIQRQRQPAPKTEGLAQPTSSVEVEPDGSIIDTMAVLPQVRRQIEPNRERPNYNEDAASKTSPMPLVWPKERGETRSQREAATPVSPPVVVQRAVEATARPISQDHVNGTIQRIEEAAPQPQATESSRKKEAINLDRLARQVYPLVKQMLAVERERRPFR